jgi:ubiquinone biosynthesis protein
MATTLGNLFRLARAGIVLAQHGVRLVPRGMKAPIALQLAHWAVWPIAVLTAPFR